MRLPTINFKRAVYASLMLLSIAITGSCEREQSRKLSDLKWMEGRWITKTNGIYLVMEWTTGKDTMYGNGKVMGGGELQPTEEFRIFQLNDRLALILQLAEDSTKNIFRLTGDNSAMSTSPIFKTNGGQLEHLQWEKLGSDSMSYITKVANQPPIIYRFGRLVQ